MEISATSALAGMQINTQADAAISVMKKSLDIQAQQGADMVKMMEQSNGLGQHINTTA